MNIPTPPLGERLRCVRVRCCVCGPGPSQPCAGRGDRLLSARLCVSRVPSLVFPQWLVLASVLAFVQFGSLGYPSPGLIELAVPVDMPSLRCNTHQRPKLAVPDEMLRLCYESHIRGEYSTSIALLLRVTVAFLIDLTELAERPRLRCTRHQRLGPWHWGLGLLFC